MAPTDIVSGLFFFFKGRGALCVYRNFGRGGGRENSSKIKSKHENDALV